jgi:uncharacterized damage-inducible protein DinB
MATKKDTIVSGNFQRYIDKADDTEVYKSIRNNTKAFKKMLKDMPRKKINYAYAEGKWTIKELLQHIIDAERVFAYRALTMARQDATPLPGFDENNWAAAANKIERKWSDLEEEFKAVRESTELLFGSFTDAELLFAGTASNHSINTAALGYVIAGHCKHHMDIINERYLSKK